MSEEIPQWAIDRAISLEATEDKLDRRAYRCPVNAFARYIAAHRKVAK